MKYYKRFNPNSISDDELLLALKELSKLLGKTPSAQDMKKANNNLVKKVHLYRSRFGSLTNAHKMAGLKINIGGSNSKYDQDTLFKEILRVRDIVNQTPTQEQMNTIGAIPADAYKRHFKTYNNALKLLNIKPNIQFNIDKETIESDLKRIVISLGRAPTAKEFSKLSVTSVSTAYHKFNTQSWNQILKLCNIPVIYNKNLTKQEMRNEILRLEKELGRLPGYYDMDQFGLYSPEAYAYKFGSYVKALKKLGFNYLPQSQWENQSYTNGKDGNLYKSKFEANIANILLKNKVKYKYEKLVCNNRNWTCDFYLPQGKIWIEADGMENKRKNPYDQNNDKIKYYQKNNFKFYIIKYSDNYESIINFILKGVK